MNGKGFQIQMDDFSLLKDCVIEMLEVDKDLATYKVFKEGLADALEGRKLIYRQATGDRKNVIAVGRLR